MAGEEALSSTVVRDNCCQWWQLSCDHGGSQLEKKGDMETRVDLRYQKNGAGTAQLLASGYV